MTLYRTYYDSLEVTPVELDDLFGEGGQLICSTNNLYPSEAAAVACLGLRLSLEVQEHLRQQAIKVQELEDLRDRLDTLLSATPEPTSDYDPDIETQGLPCPGSFRR